MMMFGQSRIFFVMARDGLLPEKLASVHPKFRTPHVVTAVTGVGVMLAAAFLPVGKLADYSNSGTLFAFMMVAISVLVLRRTDPGRKRPFRTPAVGIIAPVAILGCIALYVMLPPTAVPTRKPPANRPPAPVVSTSFSIGSAGTSARSPPRVARAPSSLFVTTNVSTLGAIAATAVSRWATPASASISAWLANRM